VAFTEVRGTGLAFGTLDRNALNFVFGMGTFFFMKKW